MSALCAREVKTQHLVGEVWVPDLFTIVTHGRCLIDR